MAEAPFVDEDIGTEESTQTRTQTRTRVQSTKTDRTGRRFKNPLGYFSSSTYQISLYMITPDAYDAFILSGRRNINALRDTGAEPGVYLVAQSGGINGTDSRRAPGFDLDYYIDNLSIKTYMGPKATMTASNTTEVKFQLVEPYGFSFLTKLKEASDTLQGINAERTANANGPRNPTRQFFILGVRFLGYDENGNIVTGSKVVEDDMLDANATPDSTALFDRYYDINIINIKFKIDGTATTYNVDAVSLAPQVAFGIKRGRINNDITLVGEKVADVLTDLVNKLNKTSEENALGNSFNTYDIRWEGDDVDKIQSASIVLPSDRDKTKFPGAGAQSTLEVTQAVEDTANPDVNRRQIVFKNDTSVQQAITQIITESSYLIDALSVVYDSTRQPNEDGTYQGTPGENTGAKISWYNLSAEVSEAAWSISLADYVFKITYVIQTYSTPVIENAYIKSLDKYYGPQKRYEYWYSGKNSEILSYEQVLNNGYFTIALDTSPLNEDSVVPVTTNQQPDQSRQDTLTVGSAAQNTVMTSLYDPSSFVTAKISILGDPDFLAMESPGSINDVYDRFYGSDGYTISANGGQVFIEIDFKEAIDYDTDKGYLSINDRILFWKYPEDVPIEGVSYNVIDVMSNFQGGTFKQTLNCVVNTLGGVNNKASSTAPEVSASNNESNEREDEEDDNDGSNATPPTPEARNGRRGPQNRGESGSKRIISTLQTGFNNIFRRNPSADSTDDD
jgi:hypothetical protein